MLATNVCETCPEGMRITLVITACMFQVRWKSPNLLSDFFDKTALLSFFALPHLISNEWFNVGMRSTWHTCNNCKHVITAGIFHQPANMTSQFVVWSGTRTWYLSNFEAVPWGFAALNYFVLSLLFSVHHAETKCWTCFCEGLKGWWGLMASAWNWVINSVFLCLSHISVSFFLDPKHFPNYMQLMFNAVNGNVLL